MARRESRFVWLSHTLSEGSSPSGVTKDSEQRSEDNDSFSLDQEFEKEFELFVRGKLLHHSDAISYDSLSLSDLAVNKEVIQEGQYNFEKEISEVDKILQPTEGKN